MADLETIIPQPTTLGEVNITLSFIRNELKEINKRLTENTNAYASKSEVSDHENRLRKLETWGAMAIGVLGFIQLLPLIINLFNKQ